MTEKEAKKKIRLRTRRLKVDDKVPFTSHLEELRYRIIHCLIAVGIGFIGAYLFKERIFEFLIKPLIQALPPDQKHLIFTGLPEAFFTYLKTSVFAGIFVASPLILYEIWAFISPGLYNKEKTYVFPFVLFSTVFFLGGAIFGYMVVFPFGFQFFISFAGESIRAFPSMKEYLSLATKLLIAFGVIFELPLFVLFLSKAGIVTSKKMQTSRKYAILGIFSISAILTPPDIVTQLMMAGPLIVLYEISILVAKVFGKKPQEEEAEGKADFQEGQI